MPVCSVIGCGIRKTPNQSSLTIHRIPRNERIKKNWLEAIGMENIKPNAKYIYICSLHFDDKCFNKTLDVTRLRDDAVPFKFVRIARAKTQAPEVEVINGITSEVASVNLQPTSLHPLATHTHQKSKRAKEQKSKRAKEQKSKRAKEQKSKRAKVQKSKTVKITKMMKMANHKTNKKPVPLLG
ncbi:hypothetical protein K1T71_014593 [Dendrolimus kikuchii]|uniref:Uncharacterized protein n=1 Tax=Dendrolimus kikuchii TaxID=765133 RepID=A0ACC1CEV9_9NEOP|nr:hypothetical protein K1T71_014593 [Dendrolimus kikuchii]